MKLEGVEIGTHVICLFPMNPAYESERLRQSSLFVTAVTGSIELEIKYVEKHYAFNSH